MEYAPIVLFVYNRPNHTEKTLDALIKNYGAEKTDLIIYSDAAYSSADEESVSEVRSIIKKISKFRTVSIHERTYNWGLSASIINGVTSVIEQYGRVIVLEDDLVTSPAFLNFMNKALDFYSEDFEVWHISGWSYPDLQLGEENIFFWRAMNCWGWATWADRWQHFTKEPERLVSDWTRKQKYRFDLDGSGIFWPQIKANNQGKLNTWAIFWYATIFENNGLCLNPVHSFVRNIGHDGSGINCGNSGQLDEIKLIDHSNLSFNKNFKENGVAISAIKSYYQSNKKPVIFRILKKLNRLLKKRLNL